MSDCLCPSAQFIEDIRYQTPVQNAKKIFGAIWALLMKSGTSPKSQYPQLADFIRSINSAYNQKVVLKKKAE
jgi:hypothetical protein